MRSRKGRRLIRAFSHCEWLQGHRIWGWGEGCPRKDTGPVPLPPSDDPATGSSPYHPGPGAPLMSASTCEHMSALTFGRVFYCYLGLTFTAGCSFAERLVRTGHPQAPEPFRLRVLFPLGAQTAVLGGQGQGPGDCSHTFLDRQFPSCKQVKVAGRAEHKHSGFKVRIWLCHKLGSPPSPSCVWGVPTLTDYGPAASAPSGW